MSRQRDDRDVGAPAVLLIIFNRPDLTAQVVHAIGEALPARMYVAADGPRTEVDGEAELCERTRQTVADAIDWPCDVQTLYRSTNLGSRRAITEAIDWFFEHETQGIIFEDDCLPDPTFFRFAAELLDRFAADGRIAEISGSRFHGRRHRPSTSYSFSHHPHTWGWATWRRAWATYDASMSGWPTLRDTAWLRDIGGGHPDFESYWTRVFDETAAGTDQVWDYQWIFSCWRSGALTVLPSRNLVRNIGFGPVATHTDNGGWLEHVPLQRTTFPLVHPKVIAPDPAADRWIDLHVFRTAPTTSGRIYRRLVQIAGFVPGGRRAAMYVRRCIVEVTSR